MDSREIIEAEAIHKDDARLRIAELVKRHDITRADLLPILPDFMFSGAAEGYSSGADLFDPFFDVR